MENSIDEHRRNIIINELKQGREQAKQLQTLLNLSSSSNETREFLLHNILNSYDKVFSMLATYSNVTSPVTSPINAEVAQLGGSNNNVGMSESPGLNWSPRSEDSDRDVRDHDNNDASKNRKSMIKWTQQVQVCPGTGVEGPSDDGFNWRKYGQKHILGAKYPRGYYRCSHRNAQGCLATKQVQRSDEDSTIFKITYRGKHTCTQPSLLAPPSPASPLPLPLSLPLAPQQTLTNFQTNLKVITDSLENRDHNFSSFQFHSASNTTHQEDFIAPCLVENNGVGNFSPPFVSPATSSSSYFSLSPMRVSGTHNLHGGSECEPNETILASTSVTNSQTTGVDGIPFGHVEFGSNFTFDNSGYFV